MGRPARRVTSIARPTSFLLFVEGRCTEPIYLKHWERKYRENVVLTVDPFHGTPASLVDKALNAKTAAMKESRKGRGSAYDHVWCVFDVDEHPDVAGAVQLAADGGIEIAVSNPCIELWFILHREDQTAAIDRHAAQRRCQTLVGFDKTPLSRQLDLLDNDYVHALRRARELDQKHAGDGSPAGSNPSSGLWRLLEAIRSARSGSHD